jgi:hypothetical protein
LTGDQFAGDVDVLTGLFTEDEDAFVGGKGGYRHGGVGAVVGWGRKWVGGIPPVLFTEDYDFAMFGDGKCSVGSSGYVDNVIEPCFFDIVFDMIGVIAGKIKTAVTSADTNCVSVVFESAVVDAGCHFGIPTVKVAKVIFSSPDTEHPTVIGKGKTIIIDRDKRFPPGYRGVNRLVSEPVMMMMRVYAGIEKRHVLPNMGVGAGLTVARGYLKIRFPGIGRRYRSDPRPSLGHGDIAAVRPRLEPDRSFGFF